MTAEHTDRGPLSRDELAQRVARDIRPGSYVNLGIRQPTRVEDSLQPQQNVTLHSENGMLGMGPEAREDQIDPALNAGKVPVTELPGAAYFHRADSFAMMMCGGHSTSAYSARSRCRPAATTDRSPTSSPSWMGWNGCALRCTITDCSAPSGCSRYQPGIEPELRSRRLARRH